MSKTFDTGSLQIEILSANGNPNKILGFKSDTFYNANGGVMQRVTKTEKQVPDYLFLGVIDWTGVNEKADSWGVLAALVYLDGYYQEFAKIGKPTHPDALKYLQFFDQLVTKRNIPIKYRPDKPIEGMVTVAEMGKKLQTGKTWHASTSSELSQYLKAELDKAQAAENQELYDELAAFYELSSGYKVPKVTFKQVAKAVLTGGLSEPLGRKVVAAISTGGLSQTKAGQKLSEKVEEKAEKIERKADVAAEKAFQVFKTVNLALPRAAFLSLMLLNLFGFATHMQDIKEQGEKGNKDAADRWNKAKNLWYKMGGNRSKFEKAIKNGSKKKPFLAKVKKKSATSADGMSSQELFFKKTDEDGFYGVVQVAVVAAWVGIATAVLSAIKGVVGKPKEMDTESEAAIDEDALAEQTKFNEALAAESQSATPEFLRDLTVDAGGMPTWGWLVLGIGVLSAGFLIIRAVTKK